MPPKLSSGPTTIARTKTACSRKTRSQHPRRKERRDGLYQRRPHSVSLGEQATTDKLVPASRAKTAALQRGITLTSVSDRRHQHHTFWWCRSIASTHAAANAQFSMNRGSPLRVNSAGFGLGHSGPVYPQLRTWPGTAWKVAKGQKLPSNAGTEAYARVVKVES